MVERLTANGGKLDCKMCFDKSFPGYVTYIFGLEVYRSYVY